MRTLDLGPNPPVRTEAAIPLTHPQPPDFMHRRIATGSTSTVPPTFPRRRFGPTRMAPTLSASDFVIAVMLAPVSTTPRAETHLFGPHTFTDFSICCGVLRLSLRPMPQRYAALA